MRSHFKNFYLSKNLQNIYFNRENLESFSKWTSNNNEDTDSSNEIYFFYLPSILQDKSRDFVLDLSKYINKYLES